MRPGKLQYLASGGRKGPGRNAWKKWEYKERKSATGIESRRPRVSKTKLDPRPNHRGQKRGRMRDYW